MRVFKDNQGREHSLKLNVNTLKVIREKTGISLGKFMAEPDKIFTDLLLLEPEKLAELLFLALDPSVKSIDFESFSTGIDGGVFEKALEVLIESIIDFFPRREVAKIIRQNLPEIWKSMDQLSSEKLPTSKNIVGNWPE